MKRLVTILLTFVAVTAITGTGILALSATEIDGIYIWKNGTYIRFNLNDISFSGNEICIAGATINVNEIDSITFTKLAETAVVTDTLYIYYQGAAATVSPQNVEGIAAEVNGADVIITNANTNREMTFVLSGKSNRGSFTYNGDYKTSIRLAGVSLQSITGAALNIKCGKRISLELADGTDNSLIDARDDFNQKAALYCKGHLEVSGGGTLSVKGNVSHAICTKEYMLVKRTTGKINVTGAANDGIHAGQYFKMNGGTVVIAGTSGDGIQAEATEDGDEDDGRFFLKGGTLSVKISGTDVAALKSDSLMSISDGKLSITTTGAADKGLKSKADINISGGEISIIQNSGYIVEDNDTSNDSVDTDDGGDEGSGPVYRICVALNTTKSQYWNDVVYLYSSDGTRIAQMTDIITVQKPTGQSTNTFFCYDFDTPQSNQFYFSSDDTTIGNHTYSIRSSVVNGPTENTSTVYYYINTEVFSTSGDVRIFTPTDYTPSYAGGTISTVDRIAPNSTIVASAGIKSDGDVCISSGSITIKSTGTVAKGISCGKVLTTTGGIINITNAGTALGFSYNTETAKGMTSDVGIDLQGGNITIRMTGPGGKGIKSDGILVIGKSDTEGPVLNVTTTGARYANSSSAKAITTDGAITINGGESVIKTWTLMAEGMESKQMSDSSIVFNGGKHYFKCNDDCIGSAGAIKFDGGIVVCYSSENDAVDSNYKQPGSIQIGDGVVFAYSTHKLNAGFDSDNCSYIQITGKGIAIGGGANCYGNNAQAGNIGSAVQGYSFSTSPIGYTQNRYYTLADENGYNLVTYSVEANFTSNLSFLTATGMRSGSCYTIMESQTKPTDATIEWYGLYLGSTTTGTDHITSFIAK